MTFQVPGRVHSIAQLLDLAQDAFDGPLFPAIGDFIDNGGADDNRIGG
jgi:hypothetical protein